MMNEIRVETLLTKWDQGDPDTRRQVARRLKQAGTKWVVLFCKKLTEGYESKTACEEMEVLGRLLSDPTL